jgi:integrase
MDENFKTFNAGNDIIWGGEEENQSPILACDNEKKGKPSVGVDNKKPQEDKKLAAKYADGCFRQRPNDTWEYRFYYEDKIRSVYGKSKDECFAKRTEVIKGTYKGRKTPEKKKVETEPFRVWLRFWWDTYKANKVGETYKQYVETLMRTIIQLGLGQVPLKKITSLDLQEFFNKFNDRPNTQKKLKAIIHPALEKAFRLGKIKTNPCEDVELAEHDSEHYRHLEFGEQNAILTAANEKYKPLIKFLLCTGIRRERALELDVSAIDWDNSRITIIKKQKKGKNQTYSVPFLPDLFEGITVPPEGKLFKDITKEGFHTYYKRLIKNLGFTGITIHSLRHTFVSTLYNVGAPIKKIQNWAGHSTFDMTADVYCHLVSKGDSTVKNYLERLNLAFDV